MSEQVRKRKQPPTFQHLHIEQAKKLKKAWIQKAQIKSKWKAEKKKLQEAGVLPASAKPWEIKDPITQVEQDDESNSGDEGGDHSDAEESDNPPPTKRPKFSESPSLRQNHDNAPHRHRRPFPSEGQKPSSIQSRPERSVKAPVGGKRTRPSWKDEMETTKGHQPTRDIKGKSRASLQDVDKSGDSERPPSLRDLKREAYADTNLHEFKADPLHKHGAGRGRFGTRGRGAGPGGGTGRGGGQPNMKLRMDFMLEKIKRDYAPSPSA